MKKIRVRDAEGSDRAIQALQESLLSVAELRLPEAYALGFGSTGVSPTIYSDIANSISKNRTNVLTRLVPFIRQKVEEQRARLSNPPQTKQEDGEEEWDPFYDDWDWDDFLARIDLYEGSYWETIWDGAGGWILANGYTGPVTRVLHPTAHHCSTCPGKAGTYENWNDYLWQCGGVPADGSDECYSNCRCYLFIG